MNDMKALEIARRLAELGEKEKALQAYTLTVGEVRGKDHDAELEAALYLFQNGGNYKIAYDSFKTLYNAGYMREDLLALMTGAFYEPNVKLQKTRYEKNCKALAKYPYLFRKDFLPFEDLPVRFYPYDDERYAPFFVEEGRFGENINFNHPVVSRNFFKDLEKPVLADDVYSMYELEYLNDNVRKSEWVARENHIYLHYTDWGTFCAHLQVLNLRQLLEEKKLVFLIGEEISQYPIDFKARFGVDYSQYPIKPVGIREISKLIWHTQLSSHNGGDFFNEVFDGHPNLVAVDSMMMHKVQAKMGEIWEALKTQGTVDLSLGDGDVARGQRLVEELKSLKDPTDKDIFIMMFLCQADMEQRDAAARIAPAVFFQPHFYNINYDLIADKRGRTVLNSAQYDTTREFQVFRSFKYIKTFTPMRRPTTSGGASMRFMCNWRMKKIAEGERGKPIGDILPDRVLNRSFMVDWEDRLYKDSVLVRFEDGKLNPKATFTALAAFLDIPYTESMTYCSLNGEVDPLQFATNVRGFDPASVYRTYDEYLGDAERCYIEYFLRDAYRYYGYDFQYYDGTPMDAERIRELVDRMTVSTDHIRQTEIEFLAEQEFSDETGAPVTGEQLEKVRQSALENAMEKIRKARVQIGENLLRNLYFVNKNGHPLNFMPLLKLDPALLEQPLYR